MHSLKNTAVAVVLLAVSFGLYQYSLTEPPEIDPALTPEIEISNGFDGSIMGGLESTAGGSATKLKIPELAVSTAPGHGDTNDSNSFAGLARSGQAASGMAHGFNTNLPKSSKSGSSETHQPPLQPLSPRGSGSGEKKPVIASTEQGVQTIHYPDALESGGEFSAPPVRSDTQIVQREDIPSQLEQGLLQALKRNSAASVDSKFGNAGSGQDANQGGKISAQPIAFSNSGSAHSSIEPASAQLAHASKGSFGEGAIDSQVKQASMEPGWDELTFSAAWPQVDQLVSEKRFADAHKLLSRFYRDSELNGPQRQRLLGWLDALAGKVIFSAEHHLAGRAYVVKENDSLATLGGQWQVPPELIYNVNRSAISNPKSLATGTPLKRVAGPFDAEIDLQARVMTLFLDGLYAGRFPVVIGISGTPRPGSFGVVLKSRQGFAWRDSKGVEYPPNSPLNGYGPDWIGLEGNLCIHAVGDKTEDGHHGCIGLKSKDAHDVFSILSKGSTVTFR